MAPAPRLRRELGRARLSKTIRQRGVCPDVVSILEDALEDAWRRVQASGAPYATEEYAAAGRAILPPNFLFSTQFGATTVNCQVRRLDCRRRLNASPLLRGRANDVIG